jgi:tetratricopeptide (TPR) repeat protein
MGRLKVFLLLWFFIVLAPVVIIPLNAMLQENRAYLAGVGIISLAAVSLDGLLNWSRRKAPVLLKTVWTGILVLVLICAMLTIQRNIIWQDDISLWTDAVLKNPGSNEAHLGMGAAYHERKNLDLAVKEYQDALIIKPEDYRAIGNLAHIYRQQGRYDLAIAAYRRVIRLVPGDSKAHYGLGLTYELAGQLGLAVQEYQKALALDPANERALFRLENIHAPSGKLRDKDGLTRY